MKKSVTPLEEINLSDSITIEKEITPDIYLQEFKKYRENIQNNIQISSNSAFIEHDLIFAYIFLQIYVECFFHQNMRKIVETEFQHSKDWVTTTWDKQEKQFIPEKLKRFCCLFNISTDELCCDKRDEIIKLFQQLTNIRNVFVHGHKIAEQFDLNGKTSCTEPYSYLNIDKFNSVINEVNNMGSEWNSLLDSIKMQLVNINNVESFKFPQI